MNDRTHLAFAGDTLLAHDNLASVALAVRHAQESGDTRPVVVMDAVTAEVVDLDLRGSDNDIVARYSVEQTADGSDAPAARSPGPGRPRLGVISREVSLLPRHWEWLRTQRGGASATLRRLVEDALRNSAEHDRRAAARDAVHRYLHVLAGDRSHYEEVLRAFYAQRDTDLRRLTATWPADIRAHLGTLLQRCREEPQP